MGSGQGWRVSHTRIGERVVLSRTATCIQMHLSQTGSRVGRQQKQVLYSRLVHFIIFWWAHNMLYGWVEAVARIVRRRRAGGRCWLSAASDTKATWGQVSAPAKTPGESPSRYHFDQLPPFQKYTLFLFLGATQQDGLQPARVVLLQQCSLVC